MATETIEAQAPPSEFSATELGALRDRQERLAAQWVDAIRSEAAAGEDGKVSLEAGISTETQERVERYQREHAVVTATLREAEKLRNRPTW